MARTADHNAASSTTARRGSRRPAQQQRAPESEAAVVLTPDGQQWLLARAAWLASQPDQGGVG
jgi:hypothetical protein